MNILLVSSKYMPEYSGSGYRAHNLYKRLTAKHAEINVDVITGSETENSCCDYIHEGFKVRRISCKPFPELAGNFLRTLQIPLNFHAEHAATARYMKEMAKPDIMHVFGKNYVTASALDFARRNNIPAIIELCNEMDTPLQYIPRINRIEVSCKLPAKHMYVCISERLKAVCLKNGILEKNLWCRPNPVDESRFSTVNESVKFALRRKLTPFTESDTVVSYIAKFNPKKNHSFLVEAIRRLPDNFKLFLGGPIVNSGPLVKRDSTLFRDLKKMIVDAGLSSRIHLESGFIKNIEQYYQMSDIYGFPTLSEGLGTPLLESIACGLPVVANRISGITDVWIKDGQNGYVSDLVPKLFAEKIMKASEFSRDERKIQSENILNVAGTKVIDVKYHELINGLCR
ncbi:MAG: glycosyltransferase family 4 protein [Victivallales bacterium]|jgi:glycosyltransferase involved in cell wall biosynthesis